MFKFKAFAAAAALAVTATGAAQAAPCSNTGGDYEGWKPAMAQEAAAAGVKEKREKCFSQPFPQCVFSTSTTWLIGMSLTATIEPPMIGI